MNRLMPAAVVLALALAVAQPALADNEVKQKDGQAAQSINVSKKSNLYDIDATGTDIKFVVEALAQCSGANIIVSPEITGPVTAHLKQMPVDSILDCLSTVQGFSWKKSGDTYMLLKKETPEQPAEPVAPDCQLLVWQCKHIKPADVTTTLKDLFPKLKVVEGPGLVTPMLSGQSSGLTGLGSAGSSYPSAGAQQGRAAGGPSTTVLIYGEREEIAKANDALSQLDKARAQISIKVAVMEISSSASKEVGIDWTYGDIVLEETSPDSGIKFGRLGKFTRQPLSFSGTISALIKNGNGKLLAEPNIAVIDGECASILIGDRILFPKLVGYSQVGTPIYDKEEEQVGIYLQIAPKLSQENDILLTLYPQVSLVTGFLKTQAGEYPQISTREARTTVMVKNGTTLSIGGLLRDDDIRNTSKVPLLGDLPIIGQFFRRNKTTRERTEIVILLTPTIIKAN